MQDLMVLWGTKRSDIGFPVVKPELRDGSGLAKFLVEGFISSSVLRGCFVALVRVF